MIFETSTRLIRVRYGGVLYVAWKDRDSERESFNFYESNEADDPLRTLDAFHDCVPRDEEDAKDRADQLLTEDFDDDDEEDPLEHAVLKDSTEEEKQDEKHHEYKYTCFRCLKSYKRKGHLVEHQKIFCGKDKQQCCPFCAFRTYKKSNLKKHVIRMHHNVANKNVLEQL